MCSRNVVVAATLAATSIASAQEGNIHSGTIEEEAGNVATNFFDELKRLVPADQ